MMLDLYQYKSEDEAYQAGFRVGQEERGKQFACLVLIYFFVMVGFVSMVYSCSWLMFLGGVTVGFVIIMMRNLYQTYPERKGKDVREAYVATNKRIQQWQNLLNCSKEEAIENDVWYRLQEEQVRAIQDQTNRLSVLFSSRNTCNNHFFPSLFAAMFWA